MIVFVASVTLFFFRLSLFSFFFFNFFFLTWCTKQNKNKEQSIQTKQDRMITRIRNNEHKWNKIR
jgi:bacteriorhodopsin